MALEMRRKCERGHAPLMCEDEAWFCVVERTFCTDCVDVRVGAYPRYGGGLVLRLTRALRAEAAAA